jgi:phosphinothricin acetyltransferase
MMAATAIRAYTRDDLEATRQIYNQAVRETTWSWRWEELTDPEWQAYARVHSSGRQTFLVAEADGTVVGFANTGPFRSPDGYELTAEESVYVTPEFQGRGIGRDLLAALIERARAQGLHALMAGIDAGNATSLALHAKLGFVEVGRLPQVAHKFGRWLDLVFLELLLDTHPSPGPTTVR